MCGFKTWGRLLWSVGLLFLVVPPLSACNVPVFRYALEHWPADSYEVTVIHDGPLSPEDRSLIEALGKAADDQSLPANFTLEVVDLKKQPDGRAGQRSPSPSKLPWVVVRFPPAAHIAEDVWAGPLRAAAVPSLANSPVRRTVATRLLGGETAVFLLLESGRKETDEAAAKLLQGELARLQKSLKLPELAPSPEDLLIRKDPPLRIAFSLLRVARNDPAEQMLVHMLLHCEDDLAGRSDPMVFPVFGRGRVLFPLVGAGITRENLEEVGGFVVGPCSCEVKRQNPGVDLLMAVDWDPGREERAEPALLPPGRPRQTETGKTASGELVPIPHAPKPPALPRPEPVIMDTKDSEDLRGGLPRTLLQTAVAACSLLTVALGVLAFRAGRQRKGRLASRK